MFARGIGTFCGNDHQEMRMRDPDRPGSQFPMSCLWNPTRNLLATGDWTTRLWNISDTIQLVEYDHGEQSADYVTSERGAYPYVTLDWNNDGEVLAAGTYDGHVRLWGRDGHMVGTLRQETERLLKVKWNDKGSYILTAGFKLSGFTWQGGIARTNKRFKGHTAPVLDVDWKDNSSFASGSMDRNINIYRLASNLPIQTLRGHTGDVNGVRWVPNGSVLASCSDDGRVKLWDVDNVDNATCRGTLSPLRGSKVVTVSWSPTGPGTLHPNARQVLLSVSVDGTLCLWDVEQGRLLHALDCSGRSHSHGTVAFAPDGSYVAGVAGNKCVNVWHVGTGSLVRSFQCEAPATHLSWNRAGSKVAATDLSGAVNAFDFRH
jgi:transducin (beta)-like 1